MRRFRSRFSSHRRTPARASSPYAVACRDISGHHLDVGPARLQLAEQLERVIVDHVVEVALDARDLRRLVLNRHEALDHTAVAFGFLAIAIADHPE